MVEQQDLVPNVWDHDWIDNNDNSDAAEEALAAALEPLPGWDDGIRVDFLEGGDNRWTPVKPRINFGQPRLQDRNNFFLSGGGVSDIDREAKERSSILRASALQNSGDGTEAGGGSFEAYGGAIATRTRTEEGVKRQCHHASDTPPAAASVTHVIRLHRTGSVEVEQVGVAQRERLPTDYDSLHADHQGHSTKSTRSTASPGGSPSPQAIPMGARHYYAEEERFWRERDGPLRSAIPETMQYSTNLTTAERTAPDTASPSPARVSSNVGESPSDGHHLEEKKQSAVRHEGPHVAHTAVENDARCRLDNYTVIMLREGERERYTREARRGQAARRRRQQQRRLYSLHDAEKLLAGVLEAVEGRDATVGDSGASSRMSEIPISASLSSPPEARLSALRNKISRLLSDGQSSSRDRPNGYKFNGQHSNGNSTSPSASSDSSPPDAMNDLSRRRGTPRPTRQNVSTPTTAKVADSYTHRPSRCGDPFFGHGCDDKGDDKVDHGFNDAPVAQDRCPIMFAANTPPQGDARRAIGRPSTGDNLSRDEHLRTEGGSRGMRRRRKRRGGGRYHDDEDEDHGLGEEARAAANRVAILSERIARQCLRVEEECMRRERAQTRYFQEQLRSVRQGAQTMTRRAVDAERMRARRHLDHVQAELEGSRKAIVDEAKATDDGWKQEREALNVQLSSAKAELDKSKKLSREAADALKRSSEQALDKQKRELQRGWAEERASLRRGTEDIQRRAAEGKARTEEEATRAARETKDALEAQIRMWKSRAETAEKRALEERARRRRVEAGAKGALSEEIGKAREAQDQTLKNLRTKLEADQEAHAKERETLKEKHRDHVLKIHQEKKEIAESARKRWQEDIEKIRVDALAKADEAESRAMAERKEALRRLRIAHDAEMRSAGRDVLRLERDLRKLQESRSPSGLVAHSRTATGFVGAPLSPLPRGCYSPKPLNAESSSESVSRAGGCSRGLEGVDREDEALSTSSELKNPKQESVACCTDSADQEAGSCVQQSLPCGNNTMVPPPQRSVETSGVNDDQEVVPDGDKEQNGDDR